MRAQQGEDCALEELCLELDSLARRSVGRRVEPSDREDLVQEVLASVIRRLPETACPRNLGAFVRFRTMSVAKSIRRQSKRFDAPFVQFSEILEDGGDMPLKRIEKAEDQEAVKACLGDLPSHQRDCLEMRAVERRSARDIAKLLGVTKVAIYKRLRAAFDSMIRCLHAKGVSA